MKMFYNLGPRRGNTGIATCAVDRDGTTQSGCRLRLLTENFTRIKYMTENFT